MAKTEKFDGDLAFLFSKLKQGLENVQQQRLERLRDRLVALHKANLVKINHSVMEMVCAKHLILKDYEVDVEHPLEGGLTCDLFATKGYGSFIVEIETGFIPPEHALDPSGYIEARIASKIVRYSSQAGKFALGIPPHYVLQFPETFILPPKKREEKELTTIKGFCDLYYQNPPVTLEEVRNARLHVVYVVDVDNAQVRELNPDDYLKNKAVL